MTFYKKYVIINYNNDKERVDEILKLMLNSEFYCTRCGRKGIPLPRKSGSEREAGHLKKLYCIHCREEINHAECKPFSHYTHDDFLLEYNNNNFDEKGNRKQTYGSLRTKLNERGEL